MLDVVPPTGSGGFEYPSKKRIRRTKQSSNVLRVDWKLPARLRKPIRPQLTAERAAKRARIIGGFARRPLTTQRLVGDAAPVNTGAEHHTADIYRDSAPSLRLVAPPYVGSALKGRLHETPTPSPAQGGDSPSGRGRKLLEKLSSPYKGEVAEHSEARGVIEKPKRKLHLPFAINILPKGLFENSKSSESVRKKLPVFKRNLSILLIGCLLSTGVIWNLQGLGRGWGVLASARGQAGEAVQELLTARAALAESDFSQSEASFADAATLLSATRQELDGALASARQVIEVLDVSGTVRSGDRLLLAGETLAQAGQHISRGLSGLLSAQLIEGEDKQDVPALTLVTAIETSRSEFTAALEELSQAETDISLVHSSFLPRDAAQAAVQLQNGIPRAKTFLSQFLKQSDMLLTVLGKERARDYLLLFANNHELRPVGGFLGSVGLVHVDRGAAEQVDVDTVYDGDGQLKEFIAPPEPLRPIVNRWYLRDSNWFVDFEVSAQKAAQFFEKEGGPTVDGVILLTPNVISDLLRLSGPVEMPAYGLTVTADNFTEVTQREVTYDYNRGLNRPKQFLADLTPVLLNRMMSLSGGEGLQVLSAFTNSLAKKDLLMFFRDSELQQRVEELGWAGKIPADRPGLVYVNNANIGGHKSDQFIEQEIDLRLDVADDGTVEAVLTVRRTHNGPSEGKNYPFLPGENPAQKDNIIFQRVLVSAGAQLLEAQGFTAGGDVPQVAVPETYSHLTADADVTEWQRGQIQDKSGTMIGREAGYTFFGNWMVTKPGQTTVGLYRYRLPGTVALPGVINPVQRFGVYAVKQPGSARTDVRVSVKLPESLRVVTTAPASGVTLTNDHEFTYRGELTRDAVVGAVFEKR